ncbi:MAG: carboxypeptidase regulatory-like domain-containing protein [Acidobacteria bacterium]|nr:carboxypeptidase regulatory-like domain-containing protein [Acidobacteriota bacterium]MCA1627242.1 carboxypeptidase regulatory-like domain-containing protein [Acidobacteriota bacterium]
MKNVFKFIGLSALLMSFALLTGSVLAQTTTTGSIEGTVTDPTGAAVAGVTVTATRQGGRSTTATTNDEGLFRIPNVEPGMYTVSIEAEKGFAKFEQTEVPVNLSRTSTVAVQLRPAGATETVTVTAGAGAGVDVTTNTTGTNISTEQFSNFPTQRTVQSLYTIAPTVTRSGLRDSSGRERDPSVGGSSGPENNYILDGVTVTDPAFGGSGANLPFEFVQELEIKTGAYGADIGKSTGGVFNVITKSGTNEFHGDAFAYFVAESFVREVKSSAIPFTGTAPNGYSEIDAGFDIGGPIVKDKLFFFGAFNPQRRRNFFLTQTFLQDVENEVTTPFYAGKITWTPNQSHQFTFSTFGDFTKQEGHLFGFSGFGANPASFRGTTETGGSNYAFRLNSTFTPNFIGEFSAGLHFQRANTIPELDETLVTDRFAVLRGGSILPVNETTVVTPGGLRLAFVEGSGGTVQRNFVRGGFGLKSFQDRDRIEFAARLQNIWGKHTLKYGAEFSDNKYRIDTRSTGGTFNFNSPNHPAGPNRIENRFAVCSRTSTTTITCPSQSRVDNVALLIAAGQAPAGVTTAVLGSVSINPTNPFLLLDAVRTRDFSLNTQGEFVNTRTESFYVQEEWKATRNLQVNFGLRWDFQQAYGLDGGTYLTLNDWVSNTQPRIGFSWDFLGEGHSKFFANYARFLETPIPLDINVRAGTNVIQNDFHSNLSRLNGASGSTVLLAFGNLGNHATPFDVGLKPQTVDEFTAGVEWGPRGMRELTFGVRGIYRAQDEVIEDGSFDDGTTYFLFNPGRRGTGNFTTTEDLACNDPAIGCFGPARRYYRALELTATKRFSNNYQFIASYVFSSLIGNYEGLFRNDNGQADPNITSLFDLVSLLNGLYGRLPNDRPHQFKFDGSYQWPFKLTTSASFRAQSGVPFNALVPHPLYGDNEGFCIPDLSCVPRGTAINPLTGRNRTPTTYNLDLGAYYPISLGEDKQLRLQLDWFNVLNNQRAIREDETFLINSGAPGINPVPNPFYGTGTIFQFPSAVRLGVKFQF